MMQESGDVVVRDLGSTNGIRINGQRVEVGRLRPGDELSIAHIRYRLENGQAHEQTIAEPAGLAGRAEDRAPAPILAEGPPPPLIAASPPDGNEKDLAAALLKHIPPGLADKYRIQVIVQMPDNGKADDHAPAADDPPAHAPEPREECHSNSSL